MKQGFPLFTESLGKRQSNGLMKLLSPQELIYSIVKSRKNKKAWGLFQHYLVLTNFNLIYWDRGIFGDKIIRYDYLQINNLKVVGVFNKTLYFEYHGIVQKFSGIDKKSINPFTLSIRNQSALNQTNNSPQPEIEAQDPETVIKLRYARGEITQIEMQDMLQTLQNKSTSPNTKICKSCNSQNEPGWKFCAVCGSTNTDRQQPDFSSDFKQKVK